MGEAIGFSARHEILDAHGGLTLREVAGPSLLGNAAQAVRWARERAAVVIVSSGPPDYEYWSAGPNALGALCMPSWERRMGEGSPPLSAEGEGMRIPHSGLRKGRVFPLGEDWPR
jgi:hypothetical protein